MLFQFHHSLMREFLIEFFCLIKIEDSSMYDEDSKDTRVKAKDALLEYVRKKTAGYVHYQSFPVFCCCCEYLFLKSRI